MRYFKFLLNRTISRIIQNPSLRAVGRTFFKIIGGILGIVIRPGTIMLVAGAAGLYIAYTMMGNVTSIMANMTTSTSSFDASSGIFSSTTGVLSSFGTLIPLVVLMGVGLAVIFPLMRMLDMGGRYGGGM